MPQRFMLPLLVSASFLLLSPSAFAADDVRLTFSHGIEEFRFAPPGLGRQKATWGSSRRYEVGLWGVNNGSAFGLSGLMHEADFSSALYSLDYSAIGGRGYIGFSTPMSDLISFDAHGFFGYSWIDAEVRQGLIISSGKGSLIEYGGLAQVTLVTDKDGGLLLAVGGGYVISDGSVKIEGKRNLDQQGFVFTGTIGWRF